MLNSWKAVWVVLSDDAIEFYKKKTDRSPKGMIPLKGSTLVSPCQDFPKRTVGFSKFFFRILPSKYSKVVCSNVDSHH